MKKAWIKLGACALALMMAMVFAGCEGPRGPAGEQGPPGAVVIPHIVNGYWYAGDDRLGRATGEPGSMPEIRGNYWYINGENTGVLVVWSTWRAPRQPVADGVFDGVGTGFVQNHEIVVRTTFLNNRIVRIIIQEHRERVPLMYTVEELFLPRMIATQSLGGFADIISGATITSMGVRDAVADSIARAGGDASEWREPFPRDNRTRRLPADGTEFDVIVVGLGGAGVTAYLRAANLGATVFGIEYAGMIGGSTITASAPTFVHAGREAAFTTGWEIKTRLAHPNMIEYDSLYGTYQHRGHGKMASWRDFLIEGRASRRFLEHIGLATASPTNNVTAVGGGMSGGGWGGAATGIVAGIVQPGGGPRLVHWNRLMHEASRLQPGSSFMTELRGDELILVRNGDDYEILGVRATHLPTGRRYEIMGRSVIVGTGGFIGCTTTQNRYWGGMNFQHIAFPHTGAGIRMGIQAGGATYNIEAGPTNHNSWLHNAVRLPNFVGTGGHNLRNVAPVRWHPDAAAAGHGTPTAASIDNSESLMVQQLYTLFALGDRDGALQIGLHDAPHWAQHDMWSDLIQPHALRRDRLLAAPFNHPSNVVHGGAGLRFNDETRLSGYNTARITGYRVGGAWAAIFSEYCLRRIALGNNTAVANRISPTQLAPTSTASHIYGGRVGAIVPRLGLSGNNYLYTQLENIIDNGVLSLNAVRGGNLAQLAAELVRVGGSNVSAAVMEDRLRNTITVFNSHRRGENLVYGWRPNAGGSNLLISYGTMPYAVARINTGPQYGAGEMRYMDPFGRACFLDWDIDLEGPFVAILMRKRPYGTGGGLDVNTNMQVLRAEIRNPQGVVQLREDRSSHYSQYIWGPIRGLYATGYDSLGVLQNYRNNYIGMGGPAMGWAFHSGRVAADHAVLEFLNRVPHPDAWFDDGDRPGDIHFDRPF